MKKEIRTTDWLIKGMSPVQLELEKIGVCGNGIKSIVRGIEKGDIKEGVSVEDMIDCIIKFAESTIKHANKLKEELKK